MIRIGSAEVGVVHGDIATSDVEAVVCPANNYLWMGSGVAGRLKKLGGADIETAAVAQGPVEMGAAVVTTGGALGAAHVIHAAVMGQDLKAGSEDVAAAMSNTMAAAEERGIESLAVPDIGASDGGLEVHLCARTVIDATIDHLLQTNVIKRVEFVMEGDEAHEAFHDHLQSRFSAPH